MMSEKRLRTVFISILMVSVWAVYTNALALTPKQIYQNVSPGVVFIFASEGHGKGNGGTGSIISEDGLVITNAHIFTKKDSSKPISNIWVFLKPERVTGNHRADLIRRYRGELVVYDRQLDLALVKISNIDTPLSEVQFGDSDRVAVGDQAYAIGHPEQGGLWSLTTGVISAHRSDYGGVPGKNLFQTEASINRGNSGGPLLDEGGVMIGVNSMIARKAEDGLAITDVNFSIKSNVALKWLNREGYRFAAVEAIPSQAGEKPVKAGPRTPKEPAPPREVQKPKEPAPPREVQAPEPRAPKEGKQGKILTEKNPFNMDELIAGMQEMEDLMEEMRGKIREFKRRR
jgi:serine protease Do